MSAISIWKESSISLSCHQKPWLCCLNSNFFQHASAGINFVSKKFEVYGVTWQQNRTINRSCYNRERLKLKISHSSTPRALVKIAFNKWKYDKSYLDQRFLEKVRLVPHDHFQCIPSTWSHWLILLKHRKYLEGPWAHRNSILWKRLDQLVGETNRQKHTPNIGIMFMNGNSPCRNLYFTLAYPSATQFKKWHPN